MKKGLLVSIYRSDYDCKLNALYGKEKAVLTGVGIPEIFTPSEDAPEVMLGVPILRFTIGLRLGRCMNDCQDRRNI
jgi:hypothetical protein